MTLTPSRRDTLPFCLLLCYIYTMYIKDKSPTTSKTGRRHTPEQSHAIKEKFLQIYEETGNIYRSSMAVGVNRTLHDTWIKHDPWFKERFEELKHSWNDKFEEEARHRALEGDMKTVVSSGRIVMDPDTGKPLKEPHKSDYLLALLLRANMPHKYRESRQIIVNTGNINVMEVKEQLLTRLAHNSEVQQFLNEGTRLRVGPPGTPDDTITTVPSTIELSEATETIDSEEGLIP